MIINCRGSFIVSFLIYTIGFECQSSVLKFTYRVSFRATFLGLSTMFIHTIIIGLLFFLGFYCLSAMFIHKISMLIISNYL